MLGLVGLALLNGGLIGASRSINGRLGQAVGALQSSFWNHLVGFLLLALVLVAAGPVVPVAWEAPLLSYCGGALVALFVAMNSHVLPRLGAVATLVLIIGGQMICGLAIDHLGSGALPTPAQLVGVALIMLGAGLARTGARRHATALKPARQPAGASRRNQS